MGTIRLKRRIDSETLHLPELKHLIGKTVDITVEEEQSDTAAIRDEFRHPPTLDELIALHDAQGRPPSTGYQFTDSDFERFDEALREWRKEGGSENGDVG